MQTLKYIAIAWISACIRNEKDRNATMKVINGIGNEIDKTIRSFKGGAPIEPKSEPTE